MKLADQHIVLISPDHAALILWDARCDTQEHDEIWSSGDRSQDGRMTASDTPPDSIHAGFEVCFRPVLALDSLPFQQVDGFGQVHHPELRPIEPQHISLANQLTPRVISGEMHQGFLTAIHIPSRKNMRILQADYSRNNLKSLFLQVFISMVWRQIIAN